MFFLKKREKIPVLTASLMQAGVVIFYCSLVATIFAYGNLLFGRLPTYSAPFLLLLLFSTSALICGLSVFGYPLYIYLKNKALDESLKIILLTAFWLIIFVLIVLIWIILF